MAIGRILLKEKRAIVKSCTPFTIQLVFDTTGYVQSLYFGIDTGSETLGSAVVNENNEVLYVSEVGVRNDIKPKMDRRRSYRRNRRYRKTPYRKCRFLNRRNSIRKDRFSPTMVSKIRSHEKEIKFVQKLLPVKKVIIETGTFDPHALKNPEVLKNKWMYQKGTNYSYANTKAFVRARDNYTCQHCKKKNVPNDVHHIVFRNDDGSDESENLICLCKKCHDALHDGKIRLRIQGKMKGTLNYATQMNSIRCQLLKKVDCTETFGFITKEHRQLMCLSKSHSNDAVAIACLPNIERAGLIDVSFKTDTVLYKKCVSYRDIQKFKGHHSEKRIPTGKILGFRKFDKVRYEGIECFIKGRRSTGYAELMDVKGNKLSFGHTPKLKNMKLLSSRKSWIVQEIKRVA